MATDTAVTSGGCGGAFVGSAGVSVVHTQNVRVGVVDAFVDVLHQQPAATPPFVSAVATEKQSVDEEDALNGLVKHRQHARLLRGVGRPPVSPQARRPASSSQSQSTPDYLGPHETTGGGSSPKVQFAPSPPSSGKPPAGPGNPQSNASPDRLSHTTRKTTGSSNLENEAMLAGLEASGASRASSLSEGRQRMGENNHRWEGVTVRFGAADDIGGRRFMEDRTISHLDIREELEASGHAELTQLPDNRAFFGVFDGHDGVYAAAFASERLLGNVLKENAFTTDIPEALRRGFLVTDREYGRAVADETQNDAGSTALAALVWGQTLFIANLGDCRAVLSRRGHAVQLSRDQDPSDCVEKQRVHKAGGYICSDGRLCGELTVTRCIGDWGLEWIDDAGTLARLKEQDGTGPLTAEPEVTAHKLQEEDEFMVMACDGLWGVFTNERVVELARMRLQDHNDPQTCARELVDMAKKQDATDNISVVVVCFSESKPARRTPGGYSAISMRKCVSSDGINRLGDFLSS